MEKIYSIENLDCANCAAKAEAKIRLIPGVEEASITFSTMQLRLKAENPDALLPLALEAARKIEPDINFLPLQEHCHHHEHHECSCGHNHEHHHHEHHHTHAKSDLPGILTGACLFAAGLFLLALLPPFHIPVLLAAYIVLGYKVLFAAGKNIIRGNVFDECFLMSIATLGALVIGEFPEAVGIMLFYRIGEYFEHKAMERSRKQIMDAIDLRPEVVHLISGEIIAAEQCPVGALILVRPGDRIPLDGVIHNGNSHIDTAPITGEPVPVAVQPGDNVTSGCINMDAVLTVRVEKPLSESLVSRILHSVESAAAGKPKIDRFITRFSRIYTPAVVLLALCCAVIPSLITGNWGYWVYTALSFLVMSCPCALVLSVPLAFFSGIGLGSKQGILFKDGATIEALSQIKAVAMDKTGTLTKGAFTLQEVHGDPQTLSVCAACEQYSTHPIAKSIVSAAKARGLKLPDAQQVEELSGLGIKAIVDGRQILCGSDQLLRHAGMDVAALPGNGLQIWVAADGQILGNLLISDTIKPDAADAVNKLHRAGLSTVMLTGDRQEQAQAVCAQLGIGEVHAQLLPHEKLEQLQELRNRKGAVMFVGDGINDAPVLSGADVGAAMGSGADVAMEAADLVFLTENAAAIPQAVDIARRTRRIAWQNVVFALAIKFAVMLLGLTGNASMWAAVFADSGVAMLCVINAVRMLYTRK